MAIAKSYSFCGLRRCFGSSGHLAITLLNLSRLKNGAVVLDQVLNEDGIRLTGTPRPAIAFGMSDFLNSPS
jgi:hypothetical protein